MKRALEDEAVQEEVPCKQPNARARPRLGPSPRQSLFFHYSTQTKDKRRRWSPYNDPHKTLQFLLVSRAHFHVFFSQQLKVLCQEFVEAVCTTEIHKFFPSAVDRLRFPAGEAMGALLRLSSVRRLKFGVFEGKPPLTRPMFEAINEMPALEWLGVNVCCSSDSREWREGAFPTLPLSLVRFKGRWEDVQHLVGREHQCEEIVVDTYGTTVLYPLNARKVVIEGKTIEEFEHYEGPLPLESTEFLEFPFKLQPYSWATNRRWQEIYLARVIGGIARVVGERKTPLLFLTTKCETRKFVKLGQMIEEIEACERNIDALLAECEKREIRLLGLRLELNVGLYKVATHDSAFMKKFLQTLEQKFGPQIPHEEGGENEWFRVESEKRTEFSMSITWSDFYDTGTDNDEMYNNFFDDLEFDCGHSREEFEEISAEFGFS